MPFTVNEALIVATPTGASVIPVMRRFYAAIGRGDVVAVPGDGPSKYFLSLESVATFTVLHALARMGFVTGSPAAEAARLALTHWPASADPQLTARYPSPISWAIAEIRAASAVMLLAAYLTHDDETGEDAIVASVFPAETPVIPAAEVARASLCLNDLLLPALARADNLAASRPAAKTRVQ